MKFGSRSGTITLAGTITAAGAAALLIALGPSPPAPAGILDPCDLARVAAHNTIQDRYGQVLAGLDDAIAKEKSGGLDPAKAIYRDRAGEPHPLDLVALRSGLQAEEAADLGHADREVAGTCPNAGDHAGDLVANATRIAASIAARGIQAVLAKHAGGADLSSILPGLS